MTHCRETTCVVGVGGDGGGVWTKYDTTGQKEGEKQKATVNKKQQNHAVRCKGKIGAEGTHKRGKTTRSGLRKRGYQVCFLGGKKTQL